MADRFHAHTTVLATETKGREHSVEVVRLNDSTHAIDRLDILVLGSESVQGLRCGDRSVRCSVVDGEREADLPARAQIVSELRSLPHSEVVEC